LTLEMAMRLKPDVLITDISMAPPNGLEVTAELRRWLPETMILIVTMHDSEEMLRAAAASGASGYLLKSDPEDLLGTALDCLQQGQCYVSPAFSRELAGKLFQPLAAPAVKGQRKEGGGLASSASASTER